MYDCFVMELYIRMISQCKSLAVQQWRFSRILSSIWYMYMIKTVWYNKYPKRKVSHIWLNYFVQFPPRFKYSHPGLNIFTEVEIFAPWFKYSHPGLKCECLNEFAWVTCERMIVKMSTMYCMWVSGVEWIPHILLHNYCLSLI